MLTDDEGQKFADAVEQWLEISNYHARYAEYHALLRAVVRASYATGTRRFKLG